MDGGDLWQASPNLHRSHRRKERARENGEARRLLPANTHNRIFNVKRKKGLVSNTQATWANGCQRSILGRWLFLPFWDQRRLNPKMMEPPPRLPIPLSLANVPLGLLVLR